MRTTTRTCSSARAAARADAETRQHRRVEGVATIRTVDRDPADPAVHLVEHVVRHGGDDTARYGRGVVPSRPAAGRRLTELPKQVAIVSYRLGGSDGVSIEAAKWQRAFEALGATVTTVAGAGTADVLVEGLGAGLGTARLQRRGRRGDADRH